MWAIVQRLLLVVASGAILVSWSEFWFYNVDEEVGRVGILLAYGMLGYLFFVVVNRFQVRDFSGLFVAACLLGFLIEGVPVAVVYSGPPFTIVWTSMAWHALLSVAVGWYLFRRVMASGTWISKTALNSSIGLFFGLWTAFMWYAVEDATGELVFNWETNSNFTTQFLFGYALFVGGHFLADRFQPITSFSRWEHFGLWGLALFCSVMVAIEWGLVLLYPLFLLLIAGSLWALRRRSQSVDNDAAVMTLQLDGPIPLSAYSYSLLIPIVALAVHSLVVSYRMGIEMNAILILIAGPLSIYLLCQGLHRSIKPLPMDIRQTAV